MATILNRLFKLLKCRKQKLTTDKLISQGFDPQTTRTILQVSPFTMTSPERIAALCDAVKYVVRRSIPGDVVECGVWRGGSMMAVAQTLRQLGDCDRHLYLYDTFEGMSPPGKWDESHEGQRAESLLARQNREDATSVWCVSSLEQVRTNMAATCYPTENVHYVKGKVEETIPNIVPEQISLLRLDTDWYESTRHELEHLFPRVSAGGVLIIDDYGHWKGARRAVDEYLEQIEVPLLLNRIDYTGRIAVVPAAGSGQAA